MALQNWTLDQIIGQLDSDTKWNVAPGGTITWGTPSNGAEYGYGWEAFGLSNLSDYQTTVVAQTLSLWGDVANINFAYAGDTANATLKFQNTSVTDGYYAWAYFPSSGVWGGSVWFSTYYSDLEQPALTAESNWGFMAYIHEIGHALGLEHMGNYDASDGLPLTYARNASCTQDSMLYSIMSYFTPWESKQADWRASDGNYYVCQTPMMNDIAAIQAIYGVKETRTGDTVYGFNATAGLDDVYDFSSNQHPVLCLYDTGGIDTLDLSDFNTSSNVNLLAGSFSSCDMMTKNISIARDVTIENATTGAGNDIISGNAADNILTSNAGRDVLSGLDGNDQLFGGKGNDSLSGGAGNDLLDGGTGADIMVGGAGDDTYNIDSTKDRVTEARNGGTDTLFSTITVTAAMVGLHIENITLENTDGTTAINASGNSLANEITGNDANNSLSGGAGDDKLYGGAGNDTLNGGSGIDQLSGGIGNDVYFIDNAIDLVIEFHNEGTKDTVFSSVTVTTAIIGEHVEDIWLTGTGNTSATGNALNNEINGNARNNTLDGGAGNDILYGGGGSDTLMGGEGADMLDGGAGTNTLFGGTGNDVFVIDDTGDFATESLGQGTDTIEASITVTASENIENISLQGTADINATGNKLANVVIGNSANNTLAGGLGRDTLTGGVGNDIFVFDTTLGKTNIDTIRDFTVSGDKIALDDAIFLTLSGELASTAFLIDTRARDAEHRIFYNAKTGALFYDADGSGTDFAAIQFATLSKNLSLTHTDFFII